MTRVKPYSGVVILSLLALLAGACTGQPGPTPDLVVRDATGARDTAITYLQEQAGENAPATDIEWDEENITPQGIVGRGIVAFTSDEWTITVSYPVVLPENAVYELTVSSTKFGWHWKGIVKPDGTVTEISPFNQMSEQESQRIAEEFVNNSPTFAFDGIEDTLGFKGTITLRCPYCWQFIFQFDSRHAGYGDRTGQALAQVITHHIAQITIVMGEVKSAVMDDMWDMLNQEIISERQEEPGRMLIVSELLEDPVYETEVKIYGKVSLLGQLYCPCFELSSNGEKVQVWYDLMVEDDRTERSAVSMEGIENGDWVVVNGELKTEGEHRALNDFWASSIEKIE